MFDKKFSLNEIEFIQNLQHVNQQAFAELVELYKNKIFNTAIGILQNEHDAEEITQEVFIEVFRSIKNFKNEATLSTWIYRIAINKSLDFIRKSKRNKRFGIVINLLKEETNEPIIHPKNFFHPGIALEQKEKSAILFAAIEQLNERQKTCFVLKYVEGLSQREISEVMQCAEGAVESMLSRAKENLRKTLGDYFDKNY